MQNFEENVKRFQNQIEDLTREYKEKQNSIIYLRASKMSSILDAELKNYYLDTIAY